MPLGATAPRRPGWFVTRAPSDLIAHGRSWLQLRPVGMTLPADTIEELAERTIDGLDVLLLWERLSGRLTVLVVDRRLGDSFELAIESGDDALDVFNHPYAYAASRGVEYRSVHP